MQGVSRTVLKVAFSVVGGGARIVLILTQSVLLYCLISNTVWYVLYRRFPKNSAVTK